jgi:hypothetical protein
MILIGQIIGWCILTLIIRHDLKIMVTGKSLRLPIWVNIISILIVFGYILLTLSIVFNLYLFFK